MTLQIIRTLHPPEPYLTQFAELLTRGGYSVTPEALKERIQMLPEDDRLLLAIESDKLMGFAHLHRSHNLLYDDTIDLVAVLVRSDYRRRGIGRRLISAAEAWARQTGRSRLRLCARVLETDLHAFFLSLGYEETSTFIEFVDQLEELAF